MGCRAGGDYGCERRVKERKGLWAYFAFRGTERKTSLCVSRLQMHVCLCLLQATGPGYNDIPLLDAKDGGCIMTCAQFERRAGRELSKKWKESSECHGMVDTNSCRRNQG